MIGLNIGADDYVTKPFTPLELMARVNSQLRRYTQFANRSPKEEKNDRIHVIGGLELNEDTVEVFVDGKPVKMTPIEFKILALSDRGRRGVYIRRTRSMSVCGTRRRSIPIRLWYM